MDGRGPTPAFITLLVSHWGGRDTGGEGPTMNAGTGSSRPHPYVPSGTDRGGGTFTLTREVSRGCRREG